MEKQQVRLHLATAAAVAAGLLLRLWFIRHAPVVSGDSLIYGAIARNWLTHGVYGFYPDASGAISPTLIRLPGYPMFLAACFRVFGMENYQAVRYVQVAVDLLSCWLAASTAKRLFGVRAGLLTLYLAALCPFTANYVAAPLTETLVLLTIALALYSFVRWRDSGTNLNRWFWILSVALAYSMQLRPDQVLLAVAVLPAVLYAARRTSAIKPGWIPAVVFLFWLVLSLTPWTVRNVRTFHVFEPLAPKNANDPGETPPLGFNRWYRSWAIEFASTDSVYWNYNGFPIDPASLPARAFDAGSPLATTDLRRQTIVTLSRYNVTALQTPESEASFAGLAAMRVRAHPVQYYVLLPLARLADMTLRPRTEMMAIPMEWWRWWLHPRTSFLAASYAAVNLAYLALGIAGFLRWRRSQFELADDTRAPSLAWAMAASILLRCALLLTLDNSEPRYTLEFFPVLLVFAGALFARNASKDRFHTTPHGA